METRIRWQKLPPILSWEINKVANVWWNSNPEPVGGYRGGPPQLWCAIGRIGTAPALLPVFLLEVRTLGGLPAHNATVHRLVVDFEVWEVRFSANKLTVAC